MPEKQYEYVYWTDRSISNSSDIKQYLLRDFSQKEVNNFYTLLESFEKIILLFPKLYPKSLKNKNVHRAVLSKQLSVFYILKKDHIVVVAVLDNRVGYTKWP